MSELLSPNDLLAEGKKLYQAKKYSDAAASFMRAEEGFRSQNNLTDAAEAANNRSVCLLQAGDAENALAAVEGTAEIFEQAGDTLRHGMAWGNQAFALEELKRNDEALQAYQRSSDLLKEAGEKELRSTVLGR
ncbi:MAG: tetratricopeptide repeat protein, partial [Anaerolineaceae bacterium]|nr:tetratricopeptide repeat protein [Anaerolineaceae bacterium]